MRKTPTIYRFNDIRRFLRHGEVMARLPSGELVPARPIGFWSWRYRLRAAWLVWTGRGDVILWPGDQ